MQSNTHASLLASPRTVTQEDLAKSLYEISLRLPNQALEHLYRTPLGPSISRASTDQNWWFKRTEWLVHRSLTYRIGDWARVYKSLTDNGLEFSYEHDYGSALLVGVLLELGADPTDNGAEIIERVIESDNIAGLNLLILDGRIDLEDVGALYTAVSEGATDIVKLLISAGMNAASRHSSAIHTASEYGFVDIVALLLQEDSVQRYAKTVRDGLGLESAIVGSHVEIVRLVLQQDIVVTNRLFNLACKLGNFEIVKMLLEKIDKLPNDGDESLRIAKRRGHSQIVELLTSTRD